jgi:hypothetical protein
MRVISGRNLMMRLSGLRSAIRYVVSIACVFALFVGMTSDAYGQSALGGIFKRGGKDGKQVSDLKPEHGPWLIFAYAFEGEDAKVDAQALAQELQRELGLATFLLEKKFDYSAPVLGSGIREDGSQKVMKYRDAKVVDGYAVLVGEFDSLEHPSVSPMLDRVKSFQAKSLMTQEQGEGKGEEGKRNEENIRRAKKWLSSLSKDKKQGPMFGAFMTRNPLLPAEFFQSPELEKFVYDMNKQPGYNEHSLLDCKSNYTVRVLTFRGDSELLSWGQGGKEGAGTGESASALEKAAERAYIAMKALRSAGYEAYQFHDRDQSVVTVGGFDTLGAADANNRFVYVQGIREVIDRFSPKGQVADTSEFGINVGPAVQPRLLLELVDQRKVPELYQGTRKEQLVYFSKLSVGFDLRPTPMAVPRYNASRIYAGARLGGRGADNRVSE